MESIALVVFDMAGTTIEDAGQVPEAFQTVLRAHGIEIDAPVASSACSPARMRASSSNQNLMRRCSPVWRTCPPISSGSTQA